jgi:hypothetical protein
MSRFVSAGDAAALLGLSRSTFDWQRARNAFTTHPVSGEVLESFDEAVKRLGLTDTQTIRTYARELPMICPLFGGSKPIRGWWRFDRQVLTRGHHG